MPRESVGLAEIPREDDLDPPGPLPLSKRPLRVYEGGSLAPSLRGRGDLSLCPRTSLVSARARVSPALPKHKKDAASMLNPFKPLDLIKAEVFTSMPPQFRNKSRTAWSDPNRQGAEVECFLEGPSFDREGNLWIVDIPFGRIFRISPQKEWDLVVQYDGWPNGLKFHKDGRAFITDYKKGLLALDPQTARLEPILETAFSEGFKGLNDLHFAANGDLYFTDQE